MRTLWRRALTPSFVGQTVPRTVCCSSSFLDGAGWHSSKTLVVPENISLLPLPPYSPELNPVENVWQYLRANWLAISV